MRAFDIRKFKKHPERKLILRHYRRNQPEIWAVEEAEAVMGNLLLIKTPQTGYDTKNYVLVGADNEVRDKDGNLVGTVEFAFETLTLKEFAQRLFDLPLDESIDFSCSEENDCWFGAKKIRLFDSTLVIIAGYGGGNSHVCDVSDASNADGLFEDIKHILRDYMNEDQLILH